MKRGEIWVGKPNLMPNNSLLLIKVVPDPEHYFPGNTSLTPVWHCKGLYKSTDNEFATTIFSVSKGRVSGNPLNSDYYTGDEYISEENLLKYYQKKENIRVMDWTADTLTGEATGIELTDINHQRATPDWSGLL